MRVAPDAQQSTEERSVLTHMTQSALIRAELTATQQEAAHPAVVETAHAAQRVLRAGPDRERLDGLRRMLDRARAGIAAVPPPLLPWPVDLAAPRPPLERSVVRALKSIPKRNGDLEEPHGSAVVAWRERDASTLRETIALLAAAWPEVHAELREILVQIALLDGPAIDGFTDFVVHGAVFIRRDRLETGRDGLPGPVRLAEALVHEGAHTRCNAASVAGEPFLRPARGGEPLVATPLRVDPRPLNGLFQQVVVLARSLLLYRRVLDTGAAAARSAAVRARHDHVARAAAQGVRALTEHRGALTDHGTSVLEDAAGLTRVRA
ncbi:HEXXH motif-containing putative peptide modification protein [Streptomyces olivoreticuli]